MMDAPGATTPPFLKIAKFALETPRRLSHVFLWSRGSSVQDPALLHLRIPGTQNLVSFCFPEACVWEEAGLWS